MSKWVEDTMFSIYEEVEKNNLRKKFNKQLKKMESQEKHRNKTTCQFWEYALKRIKE